ncbi:cellulose synthase-like protein H1 isoform X2 [Corylus avellana]|uniref:cellulose synthase-like protein H1 isoform X2 n=1 Tax=Corylus avellana TaxID=13451 RepID=UPI00286B6BA5|nr:cellulose synthase-like protein H1 isoform X2 [Corylus avellana]
MANLNSHPLYERIQRKNGVKRAVEIIILFLLLSLLIYRLLFLKDHGLTWLLALLCESWFTFNWVLIINIKWNPVEYKTYPDNLVQRVIEFPSVDMFVTTADSELEPPIITINTVLSLLAVDYPPHKLACYVSDDGCSPLTFYSLVEASKFAKLWVPFCKKYNIQVRAPFKYFSNDSLTSNDSSNWEFHQEWKRMKDEYELLCHKIEDAAQKSRPCDFTGEFSNVDRKNHPTIIKTRVSGLMTNAPYMLNVDCDMFVNNPKVVLHAMCLLLDSNSEKEIAFAQFPQVFYDGLKDDPYGNQYVIMYEYIMRGISGIQGSLYVGTGCFHRRKIIYGLSPSHIVESINGKLAYEETLQEFGSSKELIKSAVLALKGNANPSNCLWTSIEASYQIASCEYEYGTGWGTKLGLRYGTTTEDSDTGVMIHSRGWRSMDCTPDPPAFLGCAPSGGPAVMTQQKRCATGFLEILFSKNCPIFGTLFGKLQLRQSLAYLYIFSWSILSVPELCYAALPAYCIITNSSFLPKVHEPAFYVLVALFVIYNLYTLFEYLKAGQSVRAWWNNQRMARITIMSAWLFGFLGVMLKLLRISETVFEVTKKDQSSDASNEDHAGRFTFDDSPIFVPGTTILLLHLTALVVSLLKLQPQAHGGGHGAGLAEVLCSVLWLLCYWPFLKGLFGKGKHGIPMSTICKSAALALLLLHLCKMTTMG